jgi:hypothetical protein
MNIQTSHWLTAAEAANYLKVEARTLLTRAREGTIQGYVLSGTHFQTWRFLHVDLDAEPLMPSAAPNNGRIACERGTEMEDGSVVLDKRINASRRGIFSAGKLASVDLKRSAPGASIRRRRVPGARRNRSVMQSKTKRRCSRSSCGIPTSEPHSTFPGMGWPMRWRRLTQKWQA